LPPRETFAEQLQKLKDQAAKQQADSKTAVLTKNLQAQFNELQALIDRYLDSEALTSYTEAVERKKAEMGKKAKAAEKMKRTQVTTSSLPTATPEADKAARLENSKTAPAGPQAKPKPAPAPSAVPF
jgi:hypothetical protein